MAITAAQIPLGPLTFFAGPIAYFMGGRKN
jgi:hypothetical protein